jgi:hypothetical protein
MHSYNLVVCTGFPEKDAKVVSFSYQIANQSCKLKQHYDKQNGLKIVDYVEPSCHIEYSCEPGFRRLYDEIKCELSGYYNKKAFCVPEVTLNFSFDIHRKINLTNRTYTQDTLQNFFRILNESHWFKSKPFYFKLFLFNTFNLLHLLCTVFTGF